ncbi:MAG: hypothetical protein E6K81_14525 [Candidatus Eisenbacteria bacterium]|uniref:Photosynthesis system II assembly factor Ycf48/Hcf136-like domain-containing protein n=1 Tax=Eiseniibacteriota bacterium TaxID=2212470 RepID=A0A538U176_UNCEI|nr:MAG: hypothetical protein E6K81_14525 [Candidatus Eisenbacteria bacterium]
MFRDSGWVVQPSATQRNLHGVFFQADGQSGWAVGDAGAIIHTGNAGAQWSSQASRTSYNLNGVWFTSADEGWAVGNFGTLMHTTDAGANWNRVAVNASENLTDVCFTDPDTGFACGSAGVVLNTVDGGASWGRTTLTTFTLRSVSFAGARFGWVVGDGGALFGTIDRGVSWADDGAGTTQALKAVWRRRAESAWAVGSQGVAPLTTGTPTSFGWSLVNTGAFNQLEGVHFHPAQRRRRAVLAVPGGAFQQHAQRRVLRRHAARLGGGRCRHHRPHRGGRPRLTPWARTTRRAGRCGCERLRGVP